MIADGRLRNAEWRLAQRRTRVAASAIRNQSGQALVEYAIVFPLQLLLTLVIIQLAHLFVAKQVVEYSAFCAARAALSDPEDYDGQRRAAVIPLSRITGASERPGEVTPDTITVPGWGLLSKSGIAEKKTVVEVRPGFDGKMMTAEVTHQFELSIPIGNAVVYQLGDALPSLEVDRSTYRAPHWQMKGSCTLAMPWGE